MRDLGRSDKALVLECELYSFDIQILYHLITLSLPGGNSHSRVSPEDYKLVERPHWYRLTRRACTTHDSTILSQISTTTIQKGSFLFEEDNNESLRRRNTGYAECKVSEESARKVLRRIAILVDEGGHKFIECGLRSDYDDMNHMIMGAGTFGFIIPWTYPLSSQWGWTRLFKSLLERS